MDFDDILYFDWKSGDDITLNLNFIGRFLWYTNVKGPVTFKFAAGYLNVIYRNFLLHFTRTSVTIYSDYKPSRYLKEAPQSLTAFELTEQEAETIWRGIENLLKTRPKKSLGNRTFVFDPLVLRK